MVILHVLAPGEAGGLERVVQTLAVGHRRSGHDVYVAVVIDEGRSDHPFSPPLREAGVRIFPLPVPRRGYVRERAAIAALCRRLRPDVVHTHGFRPDVVDAGAARRLGIPTVTTVHGFTGVGWRIPVYERIQRYVFRRFDAVAAVSRPQVQRVVRDGVPPERVHLLPNAWPGDIEPLQRAVARSELAVPDDRFLIGWVGRLSPEKGPDVLVEALPHLRDDAVCAAVIGDGSYADVLRARARTLGVADRIDWLGTVPRAGALMSAFDVFVLSSRTEGSPVVLFEAMAAVVPIVATNVGGVPELVSPAEAFLVPSEDPAAIARAVRAVQEDPQAAATRAQRARARLTSEFGVMPWLERYDALYRSVCRTSG